MFIPPNNGLSLNFSLSVSLFIFTVLIGERSELIFFPTETTFSRLGIFPLCNHNVATPTSQ